MFIGNPRLRKYRGVDIIGVASTPASYPDRVLSYSPIQYYRFNEPSPDTTIIDYSGLAVNGTYNSGGTRQDKLAKTGVSVNSFDGVTDLAEGGLFTTPVVNEPFFATGSISFWLQVIAYPGTGEEYALRHRRGNMNMLCVVLDTGHVRFDQYGVGVDMGAVPAGSWVHIGCCWDGTDSRWFVDGVKIHTDVGITFVDGGYLAYTFAYAASIYANVAFAEYACFKTKLADAAFADLATA